MPGQSQAAQERHHGEALYQYGEDDDRVGDGEQRSRIGLSHEDKNEGDGQRTTEASPCKDSPGVHELLFRSLYRVEKQRDGGGPGQKNSGDRE